MKLFVRGLFAGAWLLAGLFFTGCGSPSNGPFVLDKPRPRAMTESAADEVTHFRVGEIVAIRFSGVPYPIDSHEETIKEDGSITLPLIGSIYCVGKTSGELQKEIHDAYVPKYYVRLTVTVSSGERVIYVAGEVRSPGRVIYLSDTTVTKAIQSAGGLTDYANHSKVWVTRADTGQRIKVDYDKALQNPAKDPPVYPGDQINVERRIF